MGDELKLKPNEQLRIARETGLSQQMISFIFNGRRRPSWINAKKLAKANPGTDPILYLEGSPQEIKEGIINGSKKLRSAANSGQD